MSWRAVEGAVDRGGPSCASDLDAGGAVGPEPVLRKHREQCGRRREAGDRAQLLVSLWVYAYSEGIGRRGKWRGGASTIPRFNG